MFTKESIAGLKAERWLKSLYPNEAPSLGSQHSTAFLLAYVSCKPVPSRPTATTAITNFPSLDTSYCLTGFSHQLAFDKKINNAQQVRF